MSDVQSRANFLPETMAAVDRMCRRIARHRERYLRAWIAATGLRPEESQLVEETVITATGVTVTLHVRRRQPSATGLAGGASPSGAVGNTSAGNPGENVAVE